MCSSDLFPSHDTQFLKLSNGWYEERDGIREEDWKDYDYFLGGRGAGPIGKVSLKPEYSVSWGIKILNESIREKVELFLYSFRDKYVINNEGAPHICIDKLKEALIKHLYPTREERLEQDVVIYGWDYRYTYNESILNDYDFFNTWFVGYRDWETDRKSTRLNSSHITRSRMPSSA